MIGRFLWWLLSRVLGDGLSMSEEKFEGILLAIREDAAAYGL